MTELADPGVHAAIEVVARDPSARMRVRSAPPSPQGRDLLAVHLRRWLLRQCASRRPGSDPHQR
jgi:hypothetical protein